MNTDIFKWIALGVALILLVAALYVFRPTESSLTRVTVSGDSQAKLAPDTAVISFSVVTAGKQAIAVQDENARKSEAVANAVKIIMPTEGSEIKTSNYSLNPQQDYYSGKTPKILGYEVRNTVTVSVSKLDIVGSIIDAATAAGANSVEGIQYVVGQASPAQGEALALATKQAMAKAEAIAASLNGRIVRVVQSTEGGIDPRHVQASNASSATNAASVSRPLTPIQSGSLDVRSNVVLVVDIAR